MSTFPNAALLTADTGQNNPGLQYATAYRGRPQAPRDVRSQAGSLSALITWSAPRTMEGVDGWRVFKDSETMLVWQSSDPRVRQLQISLPAKASANFFVCAVSSLGREGPKIQVVASSNTDQMVASGTTGATSGSGATPPPGWGDNPYGGRYAYGDDGF